MKLIIAIFFVFQVLFRHSKCPDDKNSSGHFLLYYLYIKSLLYSLFLPVIVLPPCGKMAFIPGLGFGISGGGVRIHLLAGLLHRFGLLRQLRRRCQVSYGAGFQILQTSFPMTVSPLNGSCSICGGVRSAQTPPNT